MRVLYYFLLCVAVRSYVIQVKYYYEMNVLFSQAALKDHVVYCGSKGAIDSMTRVMALELGPHGIRVNTVNPTAIMTDLGRRVWGDPEKSKLMLSKIPLGR